MLFAASAIMVEKINVLKRFFGNPFIIEAKIKESELNNYLIYVIVKGEKIQNKCHAETSSG